ncbi:ORF6N domain-containing protein [Variovorax sp. J22R133]|uniref:ORF6N domain-containing protein n=1 Tax=Variovorax brevis TaxID=3053503 RepID=UPI002575EE61|nr:ORF6N domain-containing protein [Variovorax sp. J22R133]MDM0114731.1 ORF6N domain-containing protein [Variovorax sp. J22R133]
MSEPSSPSVALEAITQRIVVLRGQKVMLDSDLAALYGVETRRLNEQVKRNRERFPQDFLFELTAEEATHLKSQSATSSWGGRRSLPMAFTEHGAIMAATVLNSPRAVEVSVYVVRAFVQLRELASSHRELAKRLDALEAKTELIAVQHETFSEQTRIQLRHFFDALRALAAQPEPPAKRSIGFLTPDEKKGAKPAARKK